MTNTLDIAQNKSNSLYWKCQFFGWGLVSLFWFYIALFRDGFELSDAIINYIFDVAICIAITHAYRTIAVKRKWNQLNIKDLIWKLIPALLILSIMFMIIMNIKTSIYIYLADRQNDSIKELFVWNPFFVMESCINNRFETYEHLATCLSFVPLLPKRSTINKDECATIFNS